jgi:hypothetical protein
LTPASTSCFGYCDGAIAANTTGGIPPYAYSPALTNLCSSTYTVAVTDNIGCIATQTTTVTSPAALTVSPGASPNSICDGNCSVLSAGIVTGGTSPYAYSWQPGNLVGNAVTVCPSVTSCYTLLVTDAGGCSTSSSVCVTVNALPSVTYIQTPTTVCINWSPITLSAASPAGGIYTGPGVSGNQFDPVSAGPGTQTIVYTFADSTGCVDSATQQIVVDLCTSINQNTDLNKLSVYPDPFVSTVTITWNDQESGELIITNILGEEIYSTQLQEGTNDVDLSEQPSGIYFLTVKHEAGLETIRIVNEQF